MKKTLEQYIVSKLGPKMPKPYTTWVDFITDLGNGPLADWKIMYNEDIDPDDEEPKKMRIINTR